MQQLRAIHPAASDALEAAWEAVCQGNGPAVALLTGSELSGKTWLQFRWSQALSGDQVMVAGTPFLLRAEVALPELPSTASMHERLYQVARALERRARQHGALCLLVDEFALWQDDDTKQLQVLWHHLTMRQVPVLLLVTARQRPELAWAEWSVAATLAGTPAPQEITLSAIGPEAVEKLVRQALPSALPGVLDSVLPGVLDSARHTSLPAGLCDWLTQHAAGRAGAVVVLIRQLIRLGALRRTPGGATDTEDGPGHWVFQPERIPAWTAPDDHLRAADLLCLEAEAELLRPVAVLAVAGRPLPEAEWALRAGLDPDELDQVQRRAQVLNVARPVTHAAPRFWKVTSPEVEQGVLGRLTLGQVRELHAQAMQHEQNLSLLARHARLSGQVDGPLTQQAAYAAQRQGRWQEAAAHLQFLCRHFPERPRRAVWHLERSRLLLHQGQAQEALQELHHLPPWRGVQVQRALALRELGRLREAAEVLRPAAQRPREGARLAQMLYELDQRREAHAVAQHALQRATGADRGYARAVLARTLFGLGQYEQAAVVGQAAVDELRALVMNPPHAHAPQAHAPQVQVVQAQAVQTQRPHLVRALMWLATTLDHLGQWVRADHLLQEAQQESARSGDRTAQFSVLASLMVLRLSACALPAAEAAALTLIRLAGQGSHLPQVASARHNLGMVRFLQGDFRAAAEQFWRSGQVGKRAGRELWALNASLFRAYSLALLGDLRLGRAVLRHPRVQEASRTAPLIVALLHLLLDQPQQTLRRLAGWQADGNAWLTAEVQVVRGYACLRLGDPTQARLHFTAALEQATQGAVPAMQTQAWCALATLHALGGQPAQARDLADQARAKAEGYHLGGYAALSRSLYPQVWQGVLAQPTPGADVSTAPQGRFLRTLGAFTLEEGGVPLPWRGRTTRHLLALLLAGELAPRPAMLTRDALCLALWPDAPEHVATGNLRKTLSRLKQSLGNAASIHLSPLGQYRLTLTQCDLLSFQRALDTQDHALALNAYRGEFLPAEDHPDVQLVRMSLHLAWREALLSRVRTLAPEQAISELWPLLLHDPADERAAQCATLALSRLPERALSRQWLRRWQELLAREELDWPEELLLIHRQLSAAD